MSREAQPWPWLVMAVCALVAIVALWRSAAGYFFLFDDFALIGAAKTQSFASLATQHLIGFYRPAGFVVLRIGALMFDWDAPAGYAALSLLLHAIASVCCFGLARTLALDRPTSALAALLFLLSPWATEAFLWVSSIYDLLATCGVLASLWCLRAIVTGHDRSRSIAMRTLLGIGAFVSALIAFFSKESAIVLPALAIVLLVQPVEPGEQQSDDRQRDERQPDERQRSGDRLPLGARLRRILLRRHWQALWWLLPCIVLPTIVYLGIRASRLGLLSGAYGEFGTLLRNADLPHNLWTYARMLVLPPLPTDWSIATIAFRIGAVYPFLCAVAPAALFQGIADRARLLLACAFACLISIAPVLWIGLAPNNTFCGRFVYLPGAWFAIGAACALGRVLFPPAAADTGAASIVALTLSRRRARTFVTTGALAIACAFYTGSLLHQIRLWGMASAVSRSVVRQMEAYRGRTDRALHVTNLPNMSTEGPWLLKGYTFRLYREGKGMPPVRADIVLVRLMGGVTAVAPLGTDSFSDYQAPDGRPEIPVTLDLRPEMTTP